MNQVYACYFLIGIASGTESSKRTVIQRLLFETSCMQGVLITDVKRKGLHHFFIHESKHFFQYQCTNDYIHWCIISGRTVSVKHRKRRFIYFRKYVLCKIFRSGLFQKPFFPIRKICCGIKEANLL